MPQSWIDVVDAIWIVGAVLMILSSLGRGVMYSFISDQFAPTKTERRRQQRHQQLQRRGRVDTGLLTMATEAETTTSHEVTRDYGLEFSGVSWNVVYGTQILALFTYSILQAVERVLVIAYYQTPEGPADGRVTMSTLKLEICRFSSDEKSQENATLTEPSFARARCYTPSSPRACKAALDTIGKIQTRHSSLDQESGPTPLDSLEPSAGGMQGNAMFSGMFGSGPGDLLRSSTLFEARNV